MWRDRFCISSSAFREQHAHQLPTWFGCMLSFYIHIDINESRHIYLFRFININMNVKNTKMTYIVKRRKYYTRTTFSRTGCFVFFVASLSFFFSKHKRTYGFVELLSYLYCTVVRTPAYILEIPMICPYEINKTKKDHFINWVLKYSWTRRNFSVQE